ncbi:MAG: PilZ domain-containing protein [Acidobacteriota bacterium]
MIIELKNKKNDHMGNGVRVNNNKAARADRDMRKHRRYDLALPVKVSGRDAERKIFQETAITQNVSCEGLRLSLKTVVLRGAILHCSLPMPTRLRAYDVGKENYESYAEVRYVKRCAEGGCEAGVYLLGKQLSAELEQNFNITLISSDTTIPTQENDNVAQSSATEPMGWLDRLRQLLKLK